MLRAAASVCGGRVPHCGQQTLDASVAIDQEAQMERTTSESGELEGKNVAP
jgi:hypothetical protein